MQTTIALAASALTLTFFPALASDGGKQSCSSSKAEKVSYAAKADIVTTAKAAGGFKTLLAAAEHAGLVPALTGEGPLTVFAPTDAAFAALGEKKIAELLEPENRSTLQQILLYHVVSGDVRASQVVKLDNATTLNGQRVDIRVDDGGVQIDGAKVIKTDIACTNGVIHVIDRVIVPNTDDIVATAVGAGKFGTLAAALKAGELVEALQGEGPFTVFAPIDSAFAALPEGTVETLLKPENKHKLQDILKFHVVPGRIYAADAVAARRATTLQGGELRISIRNGQLYAGDSKVVSTDIETANGVIHVIDSVLLP